MRPPLLRGSRAGLRAAALAGALSCGVVLAGCGDDGLTGTVDVQGSQTLLPMVSSVAGAFAEGHPLARVHVDMTGTGNGITALCDQFADIAAASREMNAREAASCEASAVPAVRLLLARDGLVFFTRKGSRAPACITPADAYALMGPESGGVANWRAARPLARALGSRTAMPLLPLRVVTPDTASGTRTLVEEMVLAAPAGQRRRDAGIRTDARMVPSAQTMLGEVLRGPGVLAVSGFATVGPWAGVVRTLAVEAGKGCVAPTAETIRDGSYPLGRSLYAYVDLDSARREPTVAAFAQALVDAAGSAGHAGGVVPLSAEQADRTSEAWDAAMSDGDLTGS